MIQSFADRFIAARQQVEAAFRAAPPLDYESIVKAVIEVIADENDYRTPDANRIHRIDDGEYQGTLVFVIGASGYQPIDYWYVKVGYGSCSGCDTLEAIRSYSSEPLTDDQVSQYWTLALHIVQGLRKMGDDEV